MGAPPIRVRKRLVIQQARAQQEHPAQKCKNTSVPVLGITKVSRLVQSSPILGAKRKCTCSGDCSRVLLSLRIAKAS